MANATEMNGSNEGKALRHATGWARHRRYVINIVLACLAVGLEIYYSVCGGACSYLKGSIFGIDLEYVGIAYMACIILLSILKKDTLLLVLIAAGVGIELYLIGFQVWHNTYCSYCLAFAGVVFFLYALNFEKSKITLSFVSMCAALVLFSIFFKGSLVPSYSYTLQIPFQNSIEISS